MKMDPALKKFTTLDLIRTRDGAKKYAETMSGLLIFPGQSYYSSENCMQIVAIIDSELAARAIERAMESQNICV
jgi:hypothetical protein